MIKQAVILSAGFGTRLREITGEDLPKVMVPLAGKPLLERQIEYVARYGVEEVFVNLHYLPDAITDYFGDGSAFGVSIKYAHESEIRGTAGGIKQFEDQLGEDFFVLYGDTVYNIDLGRVEDAFRVHKNAVGLCTVRDTDHPQDSDLARVNDAGVVEQFYTKPHQGNPETRWGSSAPYIFSHTVLASIPQGQYYEIAHDLIPLLLEGGSRIAAYKLGEGEFRKDVGTPERYRAMDDLLKNND